MTRSQRGRRARPRSLDTLSTKQTLALSSGWLVIYLVYYPYVEGTLQMHAVQGYGIDFFLVKHMFYLCNFSHYLNRKTL